MGRHDVNFLCNTRWFGICGIDSLPSVVSSGQVEDFLQMFLWVLGGGGP